MNIVRTRAAQRDLAEIYSFIAADNPAAAARVIERLYSIIQELADGELSGPAVRLSDGRRARSWAVPPYRIYYRRSDHEDGGRSHLSSGPEASRIERRPSRLCDYRGERPGTAPGHRYHQADGSLAFSLF